MTPERVMELWNHEQLENWNMNDAILAFAARIREETLTDFRADMLSHLQRADYCLKSLGAKGLAQDSIDAAITMLIEKKP